MQENEMPRRYPPPSLAPLTVSPFTIDDHGKGVLARVLGLKTLPSSVTNDIAYKIACYKATATAAPDTTVGNTLAELKELKKSGGAHDRAVKRLAGDRSGVEYTTHNILQSIALAVLKGETGAREKLIQAADTRADQLHQHPRVEAATEALRYLCGHLRVIFNGAAALELRPTPDKAWHHCRRFAMEVFTIASIDCTDFVDHPSRLTEYLGTDISTD
jgi:hypothetical protein